jgi:LAO/AO transport system kinase
LSASELARGIRSRDNRLVGRAITLVERGGPEAARLIAEIFSETGRARLIGVTGSPGAGKSTFVGRLALEYRRLGKRVGVIAIDPSSPYSGGAILGDRIRMSELYTDPDVFIRSMATRGALGGLSPSTIDAADILDAAGYDPIMIETVGVGQDEVDVVRAADSIGVIVVPGLGDEIQAIKAGILEIADVFVVNKADRDGADRTVAELSMNLDFAPSAGPWRPPIVKTVATRGEGIAAAREAFDRHREHLDDTGAGRQRRLDRARARLRALLQARFFGAIEADADSAEGLDEAVGRVAERRLDPYGAAEALFSRFEAR